MKIILLLSTVLTLTSCGVAENLRSACGSDIEMGCNALLGYKNNDQDKEIENIKNKNTEQDAKITELEGQINNNVNFANALQLEINNLSSHIINISSELLNLQSQIDVNTNEISDLQSELNSLNATQTLLQNQINSVQANVTTLMVQMLSVNNTLPVIQSNITSLQNSVTSLNATVSQSVIGMIDPCGDGPGLDEVLLKTKDGKYVAYFEQGGNRFLSVLQVGSAYQTTDSQHCNFTVTASGVTW